MKCILFLNQVARVSKARNAAQTWPEKKNTTHDWTAARTDNRLGAGLPALQVQLLGVQLRCGLKQNTTDPAVSRDQNKRVITGVCY